MSGVHDLEASSHRSLFAKEPYKKDLILQKRPVIVRSLLIGIPAHSRITIVLLMGPMCADMRACVCESVCMCVYMYVYACVGVGVVGSWCASS